MSPTTPFALAVPLYRPAGHLVPLIESIQRQSWSPAKLILLDSSPDDQATTWLRARGLAVTTIEPSQFDHGGTRNIALNMANDLDLRTIVFMTQDAVLVGTRSLEHLLRHFESDTHMAAAFGRQTPRGNAGPLEMSCRQSRYPTRSYLANDLSGGQRYFFSNAFAAYRVQQLISVGGFPDHVLFGEDAIASHRLQSAGYRVRYIAEANVQHSHKHSLVQEAKRYHDLGYAVARQESVPGWVGTGTGIAALRSDLRLARRGAPIAGPFKIILTYGARAIGFSVGRLGDRVPQSIGRRLSHTPSGYALLRNYIDHQLLSNGEQ